MEGELLPTYEEDMENEGHTHVYPKMWQTTGHVKEHMVNGDKRETPFTIGVGLDCSIYVSFKDRSVKFDINQMVNEAINTINETVKLHE